jgi:hypothetical protein
MGRQRYICLIWLVIIFSFCWLPVDSWSDCTVPPSGMVSWWGGDNNALDIVGTNNGTLQGNATYAAGKVGQAFSFDGGVGNYVEIPDSSSLNPSGAFSVDGWFYIDPVANAGKIATFVSKSEGSSVDGWALYFDDRGGSKDLKFIVGSNAVMPSAILTTGWHHIAGVYDPSASPRTKLYLNGAQVADSGASGAAPSPSIYNVRIGAMNWTDVYHQGNDRLNGKADEVEFFNRALSADEIAAIHNAGSAGKCRPCTQPPSGMISWWRGENNANDGAGTNNGTLQGSATFAAGKVGQAFSFDGVGDFVRVLNPQNIPTGNSPRTIVAWINSTGQVNANGNTNTYQGIFGYGPLNPTAGQALFFERAGDNSQPYVNRLFQMNLLAGGAGTSTIDYNTWYHVVITHDGTATKLYVNGQLENTTNMTHNTVINDAIGLLIGTSPPFDGWHANFKGLIDEVQVFNRALFADEISSIYNSGSTGQCPIQSVLTVTPSGTGSGSVTGNGLNCSWNGSSSSGTCSVSLTYNTTVNLAAAPSVGSTFSGWSGGSGSASGCSGTGPCSFNITQASGVGSPFALNTYNLAVTPSGTGSGSVTGNGLNCSWNGSSSSGTCSVSLTYNTAVSLPATSSVGSTFSGWSGGSGSAASCSGTGACSFSITQASGAGSPFTLNTYTVTANAQGNGGGTVQSNVGGVSYNYPTGSTGTTSALNFGTNVVLTATASTGSTVAWTTCTGGTVSGNGTAQATCTYSSLDGNKTAAAAFTLNTYNLAVTPSGTGSGSVTGNGLNCSWNGSSSSGTCSASLAHNTAVSLTASSGIGSAFSGWSGGSGSAEGCNGTGTCAFNMTEVSRIGSIFIQKSSIYLPLILRP